METGRPVSNLSDVAGRTDIFDLGRLGLSSGEARRLDLLVSIDPFTFGGERYCPPDAPVTATLDVARASSGYSLRLRYRVELSGPCMRCLEHADVAFAIDAREVDHPGGGEELDSPYVRTDELDVHAWARDALALELPAQIVCRADCRGICAVCGENLNAAPDHAHAAAPDPRWAKLSELRLE